MDSETITFYRNVYIETIDRILAGYGSVNNFLQNAPTQDEIDYYWRAHHNYRSTLQVDLSNTPAPNLYEDDE